MHRFLLTTRTATSLTRGSSSRCFSWSAPQRQLLRAALQHVPEYGWTQDAVAAAVSSLPNISIAVTGLVEAPYDLISFCMDDWNERLRQILLERVHTDTVQWGSLPLVERLHVAFQTRLQLQSTFIRANRWHEAMAVGARPEHVYTTSEKLQTMVEAVCSLCQDVGEDGSNAALNRLEQFSLGVIYVAAEMHLVSRDTNSSSDEETWDFLRQQLLQWDRLRNATSPLVALPESAATVAFVSSALVSSLTSGLAGLFVPSNMK